MRIGQLVDGGQVVADGPASGQVWATTSDPDVAGIVLDEAGRRVATLTRDEQRIRSVRAAAIAAAGVQVTRTATGEYRNRWVPVKEWTIHTLACDVAPRPLNPGRWPEVFADTQTHRWVHARPVGIAAALADDPTSLVPAFLRALVRRQPALERVSWCTSCLTPSIEGDLS